MRTHALLLALAVTTGAARPASRWDLVACSRSPDRAYVYYECQFSGAKSTGAVRYLWHYGVNFAADDTLTDTLARHVFVPGRYTVRLTVSDSAGHTSDSTAVVTVPTNLVPCCR